MSSKKSSKKQSKIGIVTFEWVHGKTNIGSTRIRVHWLLKYWPEAELYRPGQKYDVLIFQKAYLWELAELFDGIKILDMCDPDWRESQPVMKMINRCDAVTCSSPGLTEEVSKFTDKPVIHIPDRIDLEFSKQRKTHKGKAKSCVWFGYSHNSKPVKNTIPYLKKLGLKLDVFSDEPLNYTDPEDDYEVGWEKFNQDKWNDYLVKHDIVLMPPGMRFIDKYKSNNKTVHAWSLGLPVATSYDELVLFMSESERIKESEKRLKEVKENYDCKQSIEQYKELINNVKSHVDPKRT